jgi:hypothetical protein
MSRKSTPSPSKQLPTKPIETGKRTERKLSQYEGEKWLDEQLFKRSENPNLSKERDERKYRLCPICSTYSASMTIERSEVMGKPLSLLRQEFRSEMPFDERYKYVVCCTDCAPLLVKIDTQKGHR